MTAAAHAHPSNSAAASDAPYQLNLGMGLDSVSILTRWILEPDTRDFDLRRLTVVTAMTGDEYTATAAAMTDHVLPLLREHAIRYVQIGRAGQSNADGYVVLDDSRNPQQMHMAGPWRLSDELTATGTIPTTTGDRWCSNRAKGVPLDQFAAHEYWAPHTPACPPACRRQHQLPFHCAVGFAAEEPARAADDRKASARRTPARRPFYPLLEQWGWDRHDCADYLHRTFGIRWPRSCCTYCSYAGGSRRKNAEIAARWAAEPDAGARAVALEYTSLALHPQMKLFKTVSAADVARQQHLTTVLDRAEDLLANQPWALYRVRRVIRRAGDTLTDDNTIKLGPDPAAKGHHWRSVRALARGTAHDMQDLVRHPILNGRYELGADGIERRWTHTRDDLHFPDVEEHYVAAPAGVHDKQRARFEEIWQHAHAYRGATDHPSGARPEAAS